MWIFSLDWLFLEVTMDSFSSFRVSNCVIKSIVQFLTWYYGYSLGYLLGSVQMKIFYYIDARHPATVCAALTFNPFFAILYIFFIYVWVCKLFDQLDGSFQKMSSKIQNQLQKNCRSDLVPKFEVDTKIPSAWSRNGMIFETRWVNDSIKHWCCLWIAPQFILK